MSFDTLREWLRWTFWVLAYLTTLAAAAVLLLLWMPVPVLVRWCLFAIIVIGVLVDLLHKVAPDERHAH